MKVMHLIYAITLCVIVNDSILAQFNTFPASGNAGIGTLSPESPLTINTASNFDGYFLKMGTTISSGQRYFNFGSSPGWVGYNFYGTDGSLRSSFSAKSNLTFLDIRDANGNEIFKASGTNNDAFVHLPKLDSRLVIGAAGNYLETEGHKLVVKDGSAKIEGNIITNSNIGIGTDSFQDGLITYSLSVAGRVRAEAVKVYTDWADFVFEEGYELPTLEEVEEHIATHGHLQDIPSAQEVEANGIDLGEMNKRLLQKVEELTLYVIELNKEIEKLNNKN